jgi:hypothetical protein
MSGVLRTAVEGKGVQRRLPLKMSGTTSSLLCEQVRVLVRIETEAFHLPR